MEDFERLGQFYLGKVYDLATKTRLDDLLLYDSRDLVTHGVCVGMTGSGKTGLCIGLIEEAALDGIPALLIDPKGDICDLLLTFPELRPEDFRPWINEDDAARKGLSPDQYAAQQAELWRNGLAEWGEDGARIQRLKEAADFAIYTPGSNAGLPVSIVSSFAAPDPSLVEDEELFQERVATTATGLLALLGIDADPLQSREHILLATLFDRGWRGGQDLDLAALIEQVQRPPVTKVGVLDLESFFPADDRFALAMRINNLLAAPGFELWLEGQPLDVAQLLHTPEGKPRVSIFSIAHLGDAERMFFVSLLLNEVLGWVRTQSGTTSLRAILYMDEIFGYFPPVAEPPSKRPLLTLLKQARAFGVGVLLATQNPVDLDYKGLANTGTWFIGRLQTERDKARVLEGLEGVAAGTGQPFDRAGMEAVLAGLGKRVFLLYDVHEDGPEVFETRWAMSYLCGPLTRAQIKELMDEKKQEASGPTSGGAAPAPQPPPAGSPPAAVTAAAPEPSVVSTAAPPSASVAAPQPTVAAGARPALSPELTQTFIPYRGTAPAGAVLAYQPAVLGLADVHIVEPDRGVDIHRPALRAALLGAGPGAVAWDQALDLIALADDLEQEPAEGATFGPVPGDGLTAKHFEAWGRQLGDHLYRTETVELMRSPSLGLVSMPDEDEAAFRVRLQQAVREKRDQEVERLRAAYGPKLASYQERLRHADEAVQLEQKQAGEATMQTAINLGSTLLGAFFGRKGLSASTIEDATTAARGVGRSLDQHGDVGQAQAERDQVQQELAAFDAAFQRELAALQATDAVTEPLESVTVRPKKRDVTLQRVGLGWLPYWRSADGTATPAWH